MSTATPPVVMLIGGTDPTAGAGIVADALAVASFGCHPVTVVTAVTAQDTAGVKQFAAVEPELVIAQMRAVLEDMPVKAVKTGMLATNAIVTAIAAVLDEYPDIPLVVDPVQLSNAGQELADETLDETLRSLLLPRAQLTTPNTLEARVLSPAADSIDSRAQELMSLGCEYVLITGSHDATPQVINRLYGRQRLIETFSYERLPGDFHGSGCALAAACAAGLAHGIDMVNATIQAQRYTWASLKAGFRPGMGQLLPDRLYWARDRALPGTDER